MKRGEQDEANEASLGRGLGHLVPVHERGDREAFQLLHVTLKDVKALNIFQRVLNVLLIFNLLHINGSDLGFKTQRFTI